MVNGTSLHNQSLHAFHNYYPSRRVLICHNCILHDQSSILLTIASQLELFTCKLSLLYIRITQADEGSIHRRAYGPLNGVSI